MLEDAITDKEACLYLGFSAGTLSAWRSLKVCPIPYYKVGKRIFYKKSDLNIYIESCYIAADLEQGKSVPAGSHIT